MKAIFLSMIFAMLIQCASVVYSAPSTLEDLEEYEPLLLALTVKRQLIHPSLYGILHKNRVYLSASDLANALEYPLIVSGTLISGWLGTPENTARLNYGLSSGTIAGKPIEVSHADLIKYDNELYLSIESLNSWFPSMQYEANLQYLIVSLKSQHPLPFEQRGLREENTRLRGGYHVLESRLEKAKPSYEAFSAPSISAQLGVNQELENRDSEDSGYYYNVRAYADFLYSSAELVASSSGDDERRFHFRLFRDVPNGKIGRLPFSRVQAGDISMPGNNIFGSSSGLGFSITNIPLALPTIFDQIDIRGELAANEELEVYLNNQLYRYEPRGAAREYLFEDVPLLRGRNEIRQVFYDNAGQPRVERRVINLGDSKIPKNAWYYRLGLMKEGQRVFDSKPPDDDPSEDIDIATLHLQYGLARNHTLGIDLLRQESQSGQSGNSIALSHATSIGDIDSRFSIASDDEGNLAKDLSLGHQLSNGSRVELQVTHEDQGYIGRGLAKSEENTQIGIDLVSRLNQSDSKARVDWRIGFTHTHAKSRLTDSATLETGFGFDRVHIRNRLNWYKTKQRDSNTQNHYADGQISVGTDLTVVNQQVGIRGTADYSIKPNNDLDQVALSANTALSQSDSLTAQWQRNFKNSGLSEESNSQSIAWHREHTAFRSTVGLRREDIAEEKPKTEIFFQLAFSATPNAITKTYMFSKDSINEGEGTIVAAAYIDKNKNQKKDDDEDYLEDIRFTTNQLRTYSSQQDTDHDVLKGLSSNVYYDVEVDPKSIKNPDITPANKAYAILPRASKVQTVEVAFTPTGEVEGKIALAQNGKSNPIGNILLELVPLSSGADDPLFSVRSEYDGSFYLSGVPVGKYWLQVNSDQAKDAGIDLPAPQMLSVNESELTARDMQIIFDRNQ